MTLSSLRLLLLALVLAATVAACAKDNPNFCDGVDCTATDAPIDSPPTLCTGSGPDPSCEYDNPVCVSGECTGPCTTDTDCMGRPVGERICHVGSGACVTCDEDDRQAPPGSPEEDCPGNNNAVCDADTHTCRACAAHEECFSGVCDAGVCAPESAIVYLDVGGADNGPCGTRAAPCLTLNEAVDKVQANNVVLKYIFMTPSATPYQARNNTDRADFDAVDVFVLGTGASVQRTGDGLVIDIRNGAAVVIEGLTVKNANGPSGDGIACASSDLDLRAVTVTSNDNFGIVGTTCNLRLSRSTISNNVGGGISSSGTFNIVNNFIVSNGNITTATVGGLAISSGATTNVLEFNTIALNSSQVGIADGVNCTNNGLIARNNIIVGLITKPHVNGNCSHRFTLVTPDNLPAGEGNMLVTDQAMYRFESATDFHIGADSAAAGKAQSTNLNGELLFDVDGDPRTAGGTTVDVGADEVP